MVRSAYIIYTVNLIAQIQIMIIFSTDSGFKLFTTLQKEIFPFCL